MSQQLSQWLGCLQLTGIMQTRANLYLLYLHRMLLFYVDEGAFCLKTMVPVISISHCFCDSICVPLPSFHFIIVITGCQSVNNGCPEDAFCISYNSTTSCQCKPGFQDTSPMEPGRICQGKMECNGNTNIKRKQQRKKLGNHHTPLIEWSSDEGITI